MEQMKPVIELKDSDNPHLSAIKDKLNLSNQNYHSLCNRILKEVEVHGEHVLMSDKESHEFLKFVKVKEAIQKYRIYRKALKSTFTV